MEERENAVFQVNIEDETARSYLGYAVSSIVTRALPDVRDGLKPVHRRILLAMRDLNLTPGSRHVKCAAVVGECMKSYHPHGDAAIYDTLVGMAQDFTMRYPLVDGQGNFGSIDDDPPAAMRYTEARMRPITMELLEDLDKDTVDWQANYDQSKMEPMLLPAKFPNLLANGTTGIAVGMATKIPPHNLTELVDGITYLIDHPDATVEDLMKFIKGPDFPTAGLILGTKGIKSAYETGRGQIIMQGQVNIEPIEGNRHAIVITELPYQVIKKNLIEQIAELVKQKKIDGISAVDDFSDKTGMRVVVELKRDAHPKRILNYLLKHTQLRTTFGAILLVLVGQQPRILNLRQILQHYIDHRVEVVERRTRHDLGNAAHRAHILEGLRIAINFLDEIIQLIRRSPDTETARREMMKRFGLSQIQAEAILNMQLRQLTALERDKIENEFKELLKKIAYLEDLLSDPLKIHALIKSELKQLRDKYGDERRTRIVQKEAEEIGEEDTIPDEATIVTITRDGYIKRVPLDTYRSQRRGGRGIIAANTKEEDTVQHLFMASTHDFILFFTDKGRVYKLKAYEIPQTSRQAMGTAIINLISIEPGDKITATVQIRDISDDASLVMATEMGEVKKTALAEFRNLRSNGLKAFDIEEGDNLRWVEVTKPGDEIVLVTKKGMSIRFSESDLRSAGRGSGGVRGITLAPGDKVVGMAKAAPNLELLVATDQGYGKRTVLSSYRKQSRGGKGIKTMNLTPKTGEIVDACSVTNDDRIMIITAGGIMIKTRVAEIRSTGRSTQGVRLINLTPGDSLATVARIPVVEDENQSGIAGRTDKAVKTKTTEESEEELE